MNYIINGQVSAEICGDCLAGPAQGFLRFYDGQRKFVANDSAPKEVFQILSENDLSSLGEQLLAREPLGPDGTYKVGIDDRQHAYKGGPVVVVLEVPFLSPMKGAERKHPTKFLLLEVFQPAWNQGDTMSAAKNFRIPYSFWCRLMSLFDVWCICGHLVDCKTQRPLIGLTVKAMDSDVIKDDFLGQDVTDANGYFKIWYRSIDFKNTFLSPIINVETPFGGDLGPDVYFIIESGGVVVHAETRADGKTKDRKDRSNCWCVELCIDAVPGDGGPETPIRAVWTNVGTYLIPDDVNLNNFDAQGYGGTHKYGFFSVLPLEGVVKRYSLVGNPMQWRFMVSNTTADNGAAAVSAAAFAPVTAAAGTFANFTVGKMIRPFLPFYQVAQIDITAADIDTDGWVSIESAIARTFATDPYAIGISPANLATETWYFEGDDLMMHLNTGVLTTPHSAPAYAVAGVAVAAADYWPIQRIAIRFECREDLGGGLYTPSLGDGRTLNSIVVSNDWIHAILEDKDEFGNTRYCKEYNIQPKLAYSVYHPHLDGVALNVDQNGPLGYNSDQNDGTIPVLSVDARPGTTSIGGLLTINPSLVESCIYIASMSYRLRLTTGRNYWSGGPTNAIFYLKL